MYEYLVGLNLIDEVMYQKYREGMTPILKSFGGGFNYDFKVSEVLITQSQNKINRVFTLFFPDKETSERFFSDPEYLEIKKAYFEKAVESTTIISRYMKL
ncbi:MAG: DUF1330 domain-containing protein [Ignavibacteriales bacterium]|jgi:uncharacterized protein (DUF1330 family)|nr:MAG: DUF1330 domain-containing protein [Ignavibacteriales bacterium]